MVICRVDRGRYVFYCPGCSSIHCYWTAEYKNEIDPTDKPPVWTFNGDWIRPTFRASLLNRWGTYADPDWKCDGDTPEQIAELTKRFSGRCHLFITNGIIEYCGDCTHALSGKRVPMVALKPPWSTDFAAINP